MKANHAINWQHVTVEQFLMMVYHKSIPTMSDCSLQGTAVDNLRRVPGQKPQGRAALQGSILQDQQ